VMCDTFRPLRLATFAQTIAHPEYMFSWYQPPTEAPPEPGTIA
jgi:hypothetical protein